MDVGILALQGDVTEHGRALQAVGARPRPVRRREDLSGLDGIVLPGGESTTLALLLGSAGLRDPLGKELHAGLPVFATCAGMILLASTVRDGRPDQWSYGVVDLVVRRNGYGRQTQSFETELAVAGVAGGPVPAVFIRAPVVERVGPEVQVLAALVPSGADGPVAAPQPDAGRSTPVLCRQGAALVAAFHPELTVDRRLHALFVSMIQQREL